MSTLSSLEEMTIHHILNENLNEGIIRLPTGEWKYGKIVVYYPRPDCPLLAIILAESGKTRRIPNDTTRIVSQIKFSKAKKSLL
ncbi:MAG: hypothetical protein P0S94_04420 [Simkaniaceae bacterium]|nr:hypothetical protein [Simkaniaceae bacterium]